MQVSWSLILSLVAGNVSGRLRPRVANLFTRSSNSSLQDEAISQAIDLGYDPDFKHFDCGTSLDTHASQHLIDTHKMLHEETLLYLGNGAPGARKRARSLRTRQSSNWQTVTIPLAIHVITTDAKQGTLPPDGPQKQLDQVNTMYASAGFHFDLINTTWTANDAWATGAADSDVSAMQQALRVGSYDTLNIYFQSDLAGGILGVCSMPSDLTENGTITGPIDPSTYNSDGCQVNAGTMPGGSIYGYAEGMTAVHETGHWLGLFHVFEGYRCSGDGDLIADTPPQQISTSGCPVSPPQDSCLGDVWAADVPLIPGAVVGQPMLDSIHNIMDYSTDACYTGFTPMQVDRMQTLWPLYRAGK